MQPSALRAAEQDRSGCTFAEATRQQDFGLQAHPQDSCRPGSPAPFAAADRDFTKRFADKQFGFVCTICERLWFQSDLRNAPARAIQWLMLMHLTEEISILRKFKKRCASSHQCTINIQLLL